MAIDSPIASLILFHSPVKDSYISRSQFVPSIEIAQVMINIFQPTLGEQELDEISHVFSSNWLGRGQRVAEFERRFATHQRIEPTSVISTTCATEGLFAASELFGWGPGDEVIIPSIGFVAAASCVRARGARPVFVDIDARSLNPSVDHIAEGISRKTRAVILNHYGGYPAPADEIHSVCKDQCIVLVEDAACAVGSRIGGASVGTIGDFGVWSFDSMKILVTGDGGMIYARDQKMADRVRQYLYLGLPLEEKSGLEKSGAGEDGWWEYEVETFGRRATMNDITAAMGLRQLEKLDKFLRRRAQIVKMYDQSLAGIKGLLLPPQAPPHHEVTHYLYWIQLERRNELARFLLENGVYTTFRYWPLHKVSHFGHDGRALEGTEQAARTTLNIPCHQNLTDDEVSKIVNLIVTFMAH